jgi:hypothetical protein
MWVGVEPNALERANPVSTFIGTLIGGVLFLAVGVNVLRAFSAFRPSRWSAWGTGALVVAVTGVGFFGAKIVGTVDPTDYLVAALVYGPPAMILAGLRKDPAIAAREREVDEERAKRRAEQRLQGRSDDDESDDDDERASSPRFVHCNECDAKNNANRARCWQCKSAL